jgi:hypothetical protein
MIEDLTLSFNRYLSKIIAPKIKKLLGVFPCFDSKSFSLKLTPHTIIILETSEELVQKLVTLPLLS